MSAEDVTISDAQAIIDNATLASEPAKLDEDGRFFSVAIPAGGTSRVLDLEALREALLDAPRRKTGTYYVHDAASFAWFIGKHADADTELWADAIAARVVGVINANGGEITEARWEDHRVTYDVHLTAAWKAWAAKDGQLLSQSDFAEHIEDRAIDIITPTAADMLELAQTFQATIGVNFESSKRLSSGERQLEYRETVDAKAGKAGRMEIPEKFTLALIPFEGAEAYKVTARLRYRIDGGALRIGYRLERPADLLREAFLSVVANIETLTGRTAIRGKR